VGDIAIVTGAGSGIGRAVARRLAEQSTMVILFGRDREALEETAEAPGAFLVVQGDVSRPEDVDGLVAAADATGSVSVLVNNAGCMPIAPAVSATMSDWQDTINTNLLGTLRVTHGILPGMLRSGGGHIVMISSVAGRHPFPAASVYSASKAALDSFSEGLRAELAAGTKRGGPPVRVTTIAPGAVDTPLTSSIRDPQTRADTESYYASMTAPLTADDVADAVCFAIEAPPHVCISDITLRPTEMVR